MEIRKKSENGFSCVLLTTVPTEAAVEAEIRLY